MKGLSLEVIGTEDDSLRVIEKFYCLSLNISYVIP